MKGTDFRDLFMIYGRENIRRIDKCLKAGGSTLNREHLIKKRRSERVLNKLMRLHWRGFKEGIKK